MHRAEHLPVEQRALIEQVYVLGQPARVVAALTGRSPRSVRRALQRIVQRTATAEFALVAARAAEWSPHLRAVATDLFIAGLSIRACAARRGLSLHAVRAARSLVVAMAQHRAAHDPAASLHHATPRRFGDAA